MKKILLILSLALMMASCGPKMTVEEINKLESQVFAKDVKVEKENIVKLVDAYVLYAKQNPDDIKSPEYLFKALDVAVGINAEGPQKAIDIADIMIEQYPEFEMTPMAMFLKGFAYENMMNDNEKALDTYHQFLDKYPNSPLVNDVKSTIENIGLTPEELIKKFEGNE
mgnify:FL=1